MAKDSKFHPYHLFMLVLCVYALVVLGVEALCNLDDSTHSILDVADICVCVIFFIDFLISLYRADRRWEYFSRWGWIELASSIPTIGVLRWGRAARIMRIFRVLRGVRATKILASFILERRAEGAFLAAALVSILLIISSSISILHFEKGESNANIHSPDDAMWWAITTITTVGYGDKYPVSLEGRIVASILMIAGIGLFGTFSGFVAAWFLKPRDRQRGNDLEAIRFQLDAILKHLQIEEVGPSSENNK